MSNVTEARPRFRKSVDSSSVKGATSGIVSLDAEASSYGRQTLFVRDIHFPLHVGKLKKKRDSER